MVYKLISKDRQRYIDKKILLIIFNIPQYNNNNNEKRRKKDFNDVISVVENDITNVDNQ